MAKKRTPKQQATALLQSWAKVAVAGSLACYLAGSRDWTVILDAGVAAVLPVIYNWFDPNDKRYGRSK